MIKSIDRLVYIDKNLIKCQHIKLDGIYYELIPSLVDEGWYVINDVVSSVRRNAIKRMTKVESIESNYENLDRIMNLFGMELIPFQKVVLTDKTSGNTLDVMLANNHNTNNKRGFVLSYGDRGIFLASSELSCDPKINICNVENMNLYSVADRVRRCLETGNGLIKLNDPIFHTTKSYVIRYSNITEPLVRSDYFTLSCSENNVLESKIFILQYSPLSACGQIVELSSIEAPWIDYLYEMVK